MQPKATIATRKDLNDFVVELKSANCNLLKDIYGEHKTVRIPAKGGLYMFWWTGDKGNFLENIKTHKHLIKGKQTEEHKINIQFSPEWIKMATVETKICLYVGKTTDLQQRIASHVKPKTENIWGAIAFDSGRKPNTTSQMRIGIEKIFKTNKGLDIILENVSVSYIELHNTEHCVNRFYLEDLCVGTFFPLLNIDIER